MIAIDTNAYSGLAEGRLPQLAELLRTTSSIGLPLVTLAELKAGFWKGNQLSGNMAKLEQFLKTPRVTVLMPDEKTTDLYARLWSELAKQGTPIPTNDVWIAALCLQYGYDLASADRHFHQVPLLKMAWPAPL